MHHLWRRSLQKDTGCWRSPHNYQGASSRTHWFVKNVTNNYATIRPLINPNFGLKVLHENTNSWGDLIWVPEENNYQNIFVKNIPIYTKVKLGDSFITSGAEGLFPGGVKIGKVIEIKENIEQQTLDIKLKNEEDFSRIKIGFIVFNKTAEEIKQHFDKKWFLNLEISLGLLDW